jgi:Lipase (class 3)
MLFDNPASNIGLARWYLDSIDSLYSANAQLVLDNRVAALGLQNWLSAFYPGSTDFPAFYVGTNGAYSLFVGGGTQNFIQGTTLLDGYTDHAGQDQVGDANSYLKQCVNLIINLPGFQDYLTAQTKVFGGHSLGGAIACVLGLVAFNQLGRNVKVTTFGAPRSGGARFGQRFNQGIDCARWMNSDDPVCLVPPTVEQAPLLAVVTPISRLRIYANQRHVEGGLELAPDGSLSATEIPSAAAIAPTTNLAAWLLSLTNGQPSPHNTSQYRTRLINYQNQTVGPVHFTPPGAPPEVAPLVNRAEIVAEVRVAKTSIIGQGETQASGPLIIPKPQLFAKAKFGSIWYVTFGGVAIAVGPRRRKAGLLAQAGNAMLRRLQRQAYVDPVAFKNQFAAYLEAAADPTSGIRPTLVIGSA